MMNRKRCVILVVGDFNCPKCGAKMEHGTMRVVSEGVFSLWFHPEVLPWKVPLQKVGEEKKDRKRKDRILGAMFNYESEVRRCPKCRFILLGY